MIELAEHSSPNANPSDAAAGGFPVPEPGKAAGATSTQQAGPISSPTDSEKPGTFSPGTFSYEVELELSGPVPVVDDFATVNCKFRHFHERAIELQIGGAGTLNVAFRLYESSNELPLFEDRMKPETNVIEPGHWTHGQMQIPRHVVPFGYPVALVVDLVKEDEFWFASTPEETYRFSVIFSDPPETEAKVVSKTHKPETHKPDCIDEDLTTIERWFDPEYYLEMNSTIDLGPLSPAQHFCSVGWREGRDPCSWFSIQSYLQTHSDVAKLGINPFCHYITRGLREGRQIVLAGKSSLQKDRPDKLNIRRLRRDWGLYQTEMVSTSPALAGFYEKGRLAHLDESRRQPGVSVIILSRDKYEFISALLRQLAAAKQILGGSGLSIEIIVGDTGSTDPCVLQLYRELSDDVKVIFGLRYHFSENNNRLFEISLFDHAMFLNNDIYFVDPVSAIRCLMEAACAAGTGVGAVGAYLFFPNGTVQHRGIELIRWGQDRSLAGHFGANEIIIRPAIGTAHRAPAVTGALVLLPAAVFARIDGFDENFTDECQDVDLCLEIRRFGYHIKVVYAGDIVHIENGTRTKSAEHLADRVRLTHKWSSYVEIMDD